jgi:triacylglycerol lipase
MNFSVLAPEVNSALLMAGPGAAPMLEVAAAWDGIGSELTSAAGIFSSVTSDLTVAAWQGPAAMSMTDTAAPYSSWLATAAAEAAESATQARAAAAAYGDALAAIAHPRLVAANRSQLVSLVRSNLFGQNAPAIAAAEAAYEQMWAQDVTAMAGYHSSTSAAVAQLGSWQLALESLPGLPGVVATTIASTTSLLQENIQQTASSISTALTQAANNVAVFIFGSGVSPAIPATQNPTYTGSPGLFTRIEAAGGYALKAVGIPFETIGTLISSTSPPGILTWLLGESVTQTTYDGMTVIQITPAHPSGHYVVAIHGGGFTVQPTITHWLDYTLMAYQTGATIEVPLYPLVQQGGTAGTVVPEMAGFISMNIAAHGASNVSVYGDSAGGTIALAATEYMVTQGLPMPASLVLFSPALDLSLTNPNISLINDPILDVGSAPRVGQQWAGNLSVTNPLVSPLYGSLTGLPPTYVYSGSLDILAPDTLRLSQEAAVQGAPISFVLRSGEVHDWALGGLGDAAAYRPQIYQELHI